jgi:hypothetical protein
MKGYLQRLAASVMNPRAVVQPLAGSVFTKHVASEVSGVSPAPDVEAAVVHRRDTTPAPVSPREVPMERPAVAVPTASSQLSAFQPLVERSPVEAVFSRPETATETPVPEASREFAEERAPVVQALKSVLIDRLIPVTKEVPVTMEVVREARPLLERRIERRGIPVASHAVAPPAPEPDIQIHIGRIEVLAVPPAQRPAPAPPARKAMDLGAYLKRSDARTR